MLLWSHCIVKGLVNFAYFCLFASSLNLQQHLLASLKLILCAVFRGALESSAFCWSCFLPPQFSCSAAASPLLWEGPVLCPLPPELLCQKHPQVYSGQGKTLSFIAGPDLVLSAKVTTAHLSEAAVLWSSRELFSGKCRWLSFRGLCGVLLWNLGTFRALRVLFPRKIWFQILVYGNYGHFLTWLITLAN